MRFNVVRGVAHAQFAGEYSTKYCSTGVPTQINRFQKDENRQHYDRKIHRGECTFLASELQESVRLLAKRWSDEPVPVIPIPRIEFAIS